jgi:two-component system sensor histidine kinase YesM
MQVLGNISVYFEKKKNVSQNMLQQLYNNASLTDEVIYFLQHDISEYLSHQIDRYYKGSANDVRGMDKYYRSFFGIDNDIRNIMLYSQQMKALKVYKNSNLTTNVTDYLSDFINPNPPSSDQLIYSQYFPHGSGIYDTPDNVYTLVQEIKDPVTLQHAGNLIIDYDSKGILKSYQYLADQLKGYIVILTEDGQVIFDSSGRYYNKKYPYLLELSSKDKTVLLEEESYVNINRSNTNGVIIAGIIPKSQIGESVKVLQGWILTITLICIVGAISLAFFSITRFSKRTQMVVRAMKKLQTGNLSVQIPLQKEDELFQIAGSFNEMVLELKTYIDKVYLSELKQKSAEMIALQSQINPHFLYNTLETIRMRAISKGAEDVGEMIYILAMLFRNSIKQDMVVSVLDELEHCKLCMEMFRIRHKDRLSFQINIEPEILKARILKLTLQPIIENYLIHGTRLDTLDNVIVIEGFIQDQDMHIVITDNGRGIPPEKLDKLKASMREGDSLYTPSPSIGLRNVNERIRLYCGAEYGLDMESIVDQGTKVTVIIPREMKELGTNA